MTIFTDNNYLPVDDVLFAKKNAEIIVISLVTSRVMSILFIVLENGSSGNLGSARRGATNNHENILASRITALGKYT